MRALRPRKSLNHPTLTPPSPLLHRSLCRTQEKLGGGLERAELTGPEQGPLGDCGPTETPELTHPQGHIRGGGSEVGRPGILPLGEGRGATREALWRSACMPGAQQVGWRHGSLPIPITQGRRCDQIREATALGQGEPHGVRWGPPLSCHPLDKGTATAAPPSHHAPPLPSTSHGAPLGQGTAEALDGKRTGHKGSPCPPHPEAPGSAGLRAWEGEEASAGLCEYYWCAGHHKFASPA